jgi:LPXTG-motif cell wall-anchored protein
MGCTRKRIIRGLVPALIAAAALAPNAGAAQDLRSPDARDAATVTRATAPAATTSSGDSGGFDWGDGWFVAASVVGLMLLGLGSVLFTRRRNVARRARASVVPH